MKPNNRELKHCYNKLHNCYRVYIRRQRKNDWSEFTVDKNTFDSVVKQDFKFSGDDYKLNPYKPYIKYLIKWNANIYWKRFLSLDKNLTKIFNSGFAKAIGFILILLTFVFQDKCSKKTANDTSRVKIDQPELNLKPIKQHESYLLETQPNFVQYPNNVALKQDSLTQQKNDSL